MKNIKLCLGVVLAFAWGIVATTLFGATYTRQNARILRFQADPVYNTGGSVTSLPIQAYLVQSLVNDADNTDVRGLNTMLPVNFDLLSSSFSSTTVTAATKTVTYPQLAALMRQVVLDQANTIGIQ